MKVAALLIALGCRLIAQDAVFELDPAHTEIHFQVGSALHTIHGAFQLKRGTIRIDPATGKASGEVIVDVSSGDSGSHARDKRMHKDILQSDRYPEAVFSFDRMEVPLRPDGKAEVDVPGKFTIHGASHDVTLHATVERSGDLVTASAQFVMPYVKWGMKNPSTFVLRVSDKAEIDLHMTAHAKHQLQSGT